ncbi:heavy metal translocating P-type ATPase [Siminovitchia fortis]|uniref:Cadmium-translocating P-type ATPase n=1 Tax=Siminovitchia fortis TaxID=254758 RepID=A0A443IU85_9BACI|nr:heavy metal translocating P-type ATPase [Siminovitchia fortis]RWR11677.1 cadmium-translocating P-type ATPase [Siminovitchia fortis]WHY83194.1 heavy metal translocating P-type ATPase [Siminovitchia fortis]
MNLDAQTIESQHDFRKVNPLEKLKVNGELIAAIVSGVFILFGWLLEKNGMESASVVLFLLAFVIGGFAKAKEGLEETIKHKKLNVELLMILAAVGSAIIGYWTEGAILIFIFALSGALETYTMNKSRKEISSLMDIQPEEAWLWMDGEIKRVHVSELDVGDLILIKPGERVPSDGKIVRGNTTLDEAAITGESLPVSKGIQDEIYAGTLNINGSITVRVTKHNDETLFQKIIQLVQSAQSEKSPSQLFIERFEGKYVKAVLIVVSLMMFMPHYTFGWSWNETFYRAMILLVVASPCALVASIMPATLSAISNGAKKGILFKGGNHLEQLGHIKAIAFDKTGTLTKGQPEVANFIIREGQDSDQVLLMVASIEKHSNHPLANAIVNYTQNKITEPLIDLETVEDVAGRGIKAVINDESWKIGKEDFVEISEYDQFLAESAKELANEGKTIVYVQKDDKLAAVIALKDMARQESLKAIDQLKKQGLFTVMLTGDNEKTAKVIASESHVQDFIANCLPENKVAQLKKLQEKYGTVAMVGDGINDAPALAASNVGISVGDGTDVALETADMILMKNDLLRIPEAIKLSKRMDRIIKQNIFFSIIVIALLILSNFSQVIDLPLGVIGHEGSTILVILNSLRLLK